MPGRCVGVVCVVLAGVKAGSVVTCVIGPGLGGDVRGVWLKRASAMVARAAAGMGAEGGRAAVWVRMRPGCRQMGVRCWGGWMGGGSGARAGLAVAGGAGVRGCVRAGAAVGGVRVGVRRGGRVGGAWNVGVLGASQRLRRRCF